MTGEAPSQLKMIELADADRLKCVLKEGLDGVLVKCVHRYPSVKQAALKLTSLRLQIRCLFFFPTLKQMKSKRCSVLMDTLVKELVRMATTEYKPEMKMIVENKDCQVSH